MKKSTVLVLLIALALGAYVYFVEYKSDKKRDGEEETSKPAFTFKSEEVAALTITNKGQTVQLESADNNWKITQPIQTAADNATVDSIISAVSSATIDRSLVITENLKRGSGLAQPGIIVEVKLKNGTLHKILLGKKDPTDASVYAQIEPNPNVLLLPGTLLASADKTLNDLRSKAILDIDQQALSSIRIKNQNGSLLAEKNAENKWLVKEPADKKDKEADSLKLLTLLSTQATEIIDTPDDKTKAAAAKTVVEVEFKGGDKINEKVSISAADGESVYVHVASKSSIFKASKSLLESLNFKLVDALVAPPPPPASASSEPTANEAPKK